MLLWYRYHCHGYYQEKVSHPPILGVTKSKHSEDAVAATNIKLTVDDIAYLEELYTAHNVVGARETNNSRYKFT